MTPRIFPAFLLLAILPACSEASPMLMVTLDDGGVPSDGAPVDDATVVDDGSGSDAPELGDVPGTDALIAPGTDAPPIDPMDAGTSDDSGADAPAMAGALCFNGRIDTGEVCDPGEAPDGGSPVTIPGYPRCPDCSAHICPAGFLLDADTNRCVGGGGAATVYCSGGRRMSWDDVTERNRYFALLRAEMAADGLTDRRGMLALQRISGLANQFYWVEGDGARRPASALPPFGDRFPLTPDGPRSLTLTASTAEVFISGPTNVFCLLDPPGTVR